jgi:acetoin utilization deacetylase AcuC-like enzyme
MGSTLSSKLTVLWSPETKRMVAGPMDKPDRVDWAVHEALSWSFAQTIKVTELGDWERVQLAIRQVHGFSSPTELTMASTEVPGVTLDVKDQKDYLHCVSSVSEPTSVSVNMAVSLACQGALLAIDSMTPVFVTTRPPGHHAHGSTAEGFCFVNNALVAARYAINANPKLIRRVLIVDMDIHCGGGVLKTFRDDTRFDASFKDQVFYLSTVLLTARDKKKPLSMYDSPDSLEGHRQTAFIEGSRSRVEKLGLAQDMTMILAELMSDRPIDLLIFSTGLDAHEDDDMAKSTFSSRSIVTDAWKDETYFTFTSVVRNAVGTKVPVVSLLEGGYTEKSVRGGLGAHFKALAGVKYNGE